MEQCRNAQATIVDHASTYQSITYQTTPYHPLYGSFPKDIQLKLTTHPSFCDNSKLSKIRLRTKVGCTKSDSTTDLKVWVGGWEPDLEEVGGWL